MRYEKIIDDFIAISKEIIGSQLIGIYVHGSLAMKCFNPDKSDIDLLVVIKNKITDIQKKEFMYHVVKLNDQAPAKGIELSIVKREYCKPFVYPTPYELHFSPIHLQTFKDDPQKYVKNMKGEDKDLAAHITIINKYGIVLYGEQIESVFGEVPENDYIESIASDVKSALEDIVGDPLYVILNVCRVLAFLKEGLYLSKQQGGEWGLANVPEKYRSLLIQALEYYQTNQTMEPDINLLLLFADEMLRNIEIEKDSRLSD